MGEDDEAGQPWPKINFAYFDTMNDFLELTIDFVEGARNAEDDFRMGLYLKMASRCLRGAMELYGDRLTQTLDEMKTGGKVQ